MSHPKKIECELCPIIEFEGVIYPCHITYLGSLSIVSNSVRNKLARFFFQLVAIGPTTEAALLEYKLKVWSVASKPTPEDLLEAILK
jgi:hypothetical protein